MDHPVIDKIDAIFKNDAADQILKDYAALLFDLATISEGGKVDNPAAFTRRVGKLMTDAI